MENNDYLVVHDITKVINNNKVIDHVTLHLKPGNIYGLQGKNGSGKTMIIKAMCGLIRLHEGEVIVGGLILGKDRDFPESVGASIEMPGFIGRYTAFKNLKVLANLRGVISDLEIEETLKIVGLEDIGKKKYRHFSLGMKQKLGIAAAIMEHPKLILLDEPANALDEQSVRNLRIILQKEKERGALIVLSSHDAEELSILSDEIFVIENGHIEKTYRPGNV